MREGREHEGIFNITTKEEKTKLITCVVEYMVGNGKISCLISIVDYVEAKAKTSTTF